jgi:hypothetical protein
MSEEGWIIRVEALRLARNAVKLNIRDRGERLKDYSMCEITKLAELWRDRFLDQATVNLAKWAEEKSKHMHRNRAPEKSKGSAVQISSPKVEALTWRR